MRDLLEQRLAARLREIGATVSDDIVVPADLQSQVNRERRHATRVRRWPAVAAAAVILAVVGSLVAVRGASDHGSVRVASRSTTPVPDDLQTGSVMLSAYDHYVISLDSHGRRNATMVSGRGEITYARATDTHHAIWYLSHRAGTNGCGNVVRADVDGRSSTIVTRSVAFDVSHDGSRLALYGAGDLAHNDCSPVHAAGTGRVVILDPATMKSSEVPLDGVTSLRWSLDGSSVLVIRCAPTGCTAYRIDVPAELGRGLRMVALPALASPAGVTVQAEFAWAGLVVLRSSSDAASGTPVQTIDLYGPDGTGGALRIFDGSGRWSLRQVVPTTSGTFILAAPGRRAGPRSTPDAGLGLYRFEGGRLVLIRPMSGSMTLTAVSPLPSG